MNTDFPEDLFVPEQHLLSLYLEKLKLGMNIIKNKSIIFCGICRDVENTIERNILCLHRTGQLFKDYHIFLYENDSTDNTVNIIHKYSNDKLKYISENRDDKNYRQDIDNGKDMWHYNRCQILSDYRNKYLDYIKNFYHYDYLCVLDLDVKGGWSYDGIKDAIFTLERDITYGCVSSYGILSDYHNIENLESINQSNYLMYDSFAFRPIGVRGIHMLNTSRFNSIIFKRGEDPIEVNSNFGGMAIYKMHTIKDKIYKARQFKEGFVDPDHVVFNEQIINDGYKIILDPSMIVSYSNHKYSRTNND